MFSCLSALDFWNIQIVIFLPDVACKIQVWNRLKIQFIKFNISNWRISKIECRYVGGNIHTIVISICWNTSAMDILDHLLIFQPITKQLCIFTWSSIFWLVEKVVDGPIFYYTGIPIRTSEWKYDFAKARFFGLHSLIF